MEYDNLLVSAIITTHNRRKDLEDALQSVLNQTYKNLECIVIDDASNDDTSEFMEKIAASNKQVRYIYIPKSESKGGNYARNTGIKNARGDLIAFLDDDDLWLTDKIEKQVKCLQQHPECELVYCHRIREINRSFAYIPKYNDNLSGDMHERIFTQIPCSTSTIVCTKRILESVGMFDESVRFWQEYELLMRISQKTQFAVVNEPLVIYRCDYCDNARLTNKYDEWVKSVDFIYKKHNDKIQNLDESIQKQMKNLFKRDAVTRLFASGKRKQAKLMLRDIAKEIHKKETLIRSIFGFSNLQMLKLKRFFKQINTIPDDKYMQLYNSIVKRNG